MGRGKIPVKKIENNTNRQVTFSKRKIGVLKKAHELSTLCDVDVALIMFSPSNRLSFYSGKNRIEDVISRYVNLPDHETAGNLKDKEFLINTLNKLKNEKDIASERPSHSTSTPPNVEDILKEISQLQQEIDKAEKQLRMFEPQPEKFTSFEELEQCELQLTKALSQVTTRIDYLSRAQHKQPAKIGV